MAKGNNESLVVIVHHYTSLSSPETSRNDPEMKDWRKVANVKMRA